MDSVSAPLYAMGVDSKEPCRLSLDLPKAVVPWMALLKVSCLEDLELAAQPGHCGMKMVKAGG